MEPVGRGEDFISELAFPHLEKRNPLNYHEISVRVAIIKRIRERECVGSCAVERQPLNMLVEI